MDNEKLYQRIKEKAQERLKGVIAEQQVGYTGYVYEEMEKIMLEEGIDIPMKEQGINTF